MNSSLEVDTRCRRRQRIPHRTGFSARCAHWSSAYGRDPATMSDVRYTPNPNRRPRRPLVRGRTGNADTFHQAPAGLFGILTVWPVVAGCYYMRIPTLVAWPVSAEAELPAYWRFVSTANVTYRGITIGK